MEGMSSYQLFADPSWSYGTPAPTYPAAPPSAFTNWQPNSLTPPYPAGSTSPDPHAAFFDPTNLGAGPGGSFRSVTSTPANGNGNASGGRASSVGETSAPGESKASSTGKWRPDREAPVKNACLTCRGKKARCDGTRPICGQCSKKSLECVYVKSRRGGARKKREAPPPTALQAFLKKLDGLVSVQDPSLSPGDSELGDDTTNIVRTFSCKDEIEVHPFMPVMPPRIWQSEVLPILSQESPFLLAVQTVLVLVPHRKDPHPNSHASKAMRMRASVELGQYTMAVIEKKLAQESSIECVQALCILSLWEWGNAGNLTKNRARAGQAIQVAMELGMHEMDNHPNGVTVEGADWRRDMARRTWWVTYVAQLSAAMISGNAPVMGPDDPRIKVDFPVCTLEDHSWPNWVNTVRHCVRAFGLINSVYYGPQSAEEAAAAAAAAEANAGGASWGSPSHQPLTDAQIAENRQKIIDVDNRVMEYMKQAEATSIIDLVPGGEEEVVRNMQLSARLGLAVVHIHIHRQQAFPEVSLFSKGICGLPSAPDFSESASIPLLDQVAVPQALADGVPYSETAEYTALNNAMQQLDPTAPPPTLGISKSENDLDTSDFDFEMDFTQELWQPETYPEDLPAPWFAHSGGAAALYQPVYAAPQHLSLPPLTATISPIPPSEASVANGNGERRGSVVSQRSGTPQRSATPSKGPHKAWGVDENSKIVAKAGADKGLSQVFPPGISLARCATAAHTIVRLEVLHRSAVIAMWDGPPKWLPFCACGLVTGAYAFLLLALAVQAENNFGEYDDGKNEEVEALLTNVKVILAGLEAYGTMWAGIEVMANEVRAALEAAMRLPSEVRGQIESLHGSPPESSSGSHLAMGFPSH